MATTVKADSESGEGKQSLVERFRDYARTLLFEWKKISYPDRKQLQQSTIVVFVFVMVFIAIISVYDAIVGWFFSKLINPPI